MHGWGASDGEGWVGSGLRLLKHDAWDPCPAPLFASPRSESSCLSSMFTGLGERNQKPDALHGDK